MYKRKVPPTTTMQEIQPLLLTIPQAAVMLYQVAIEVQITPAACPGRVLVAEYQVVS